MGIGEPKYAPVSSWESLNKNLEEALESYNELNTMMNLVLFEDAMMHVWVDRLLLSRMKPGQPGSAPIVTNCPTQDRLIPELRAPCNTDLS